jgi:hypothetical protein
MFNLHHRNAEQYVPQVHWTQDQLRAESPSPQDVDPRRAALHKARLEARTIEKSLTRDQRARARGLADVLQKQVPGAKRFPTYLFALRQEQERIK